MSRRTSSLRSLTSLSMGRADVMADRVLARIRSGDGSHVGVGYGSFQVQDKLARAQALRQGARDASNHLSAIKV